MSDGTSAARTAPDPWLGHVIADRYAVGQRIGEGATSNVYRAFQCSLGRHVAIKLPLPFFERQQRFLDEARMLDLVGPWAVSVIDVGATADGIPYLVTEFVEGHTLAEALWRQGPFEVGRAARLAGELSRFLIAAHHFSIVHRDLKPANVMLARDEVRGESIKVVDFGLATMRDQPAPPPAEGLYGTPAYMAPETISGAEATASSDVYSLGCVLFEMLAGSPPFTGTVAEVLAQHLYDAPPLLPGPRVPLGMAALVGSMLARDPAVRPTAAEAGLVLAGFAG
jgi:serine/threonine protein kinase